jgi:hypothetical protein
MVFPEMSTRFPSDVDTFYLRCLYPFPRMSITAISRFEQSADLAIY